MHVTGVEIGAGGVVQFALAGNAVKRGGGKRQRQNVVADVLRQAMCQKPVSVGGIGALGGIDTGEH